MYTSIKSAVQLMELSHLDWLLGEEIIKSILADQSIAGLLIFKTLTFLSGGGDRPLADHLGDVRHVREGRAHHGALLQNPSLHRQVSRNPVGPAAAPSSGTGGLGYLIFAHFSVACICIWIFNEEACWLSFS